MMVMRLPRAGFFNAVRLVPLDVLFGCILLCFHVCASLYFPLFKSLSVL